MRRSLAAALAATGAAWWLLVGDTRAANATNPVPAPATAPADASSSEPTTSPRRAFAAASAIEASSRSAEAARPAEIQVDGFNVRGVLQSERVRDETGALRLGIRLGGGEIRASRLRRESRSSRTTECRYGPWIPLRAAEGSFGFALAPGWWRLEARHRPADPSEPHLIEAWCAVLQVGAEPIDLGVLRLTGPVTRGVVLDETGAPRRETVSFSDKMPLPEPTPLPTAGAELSFETDAEGRFAFTYVRRDVRAEALPAPSAEVLEFYGDGTLTARGATLRPVRFGGFYVLRPPPPATVSLTLAIHAEPPLAVLCIGPDGVVATEATSVHRDADGVLRLPLDLPPGVHRLELSREDDFFGCRLLVATSEAKEIRPEWRAARAVEGAAEDGALVRRLVRCGAEVVPVGRAIAVDGRWTWRGLPPDAEAEFEQGGRRYVVPTNAPLRVRVE
jgi:hypothetical protein